MGPLRLALERLHGALIEATPVLLPKINNSHRRT